MFVCVVVWFVSFGGLFDCRLLRGCLRFGRLTKYGSFPFGNVVWATLLFGFRCGLVWLCLGLVGCCCLRVVVFCVFDVVKFDGFVWIVLVLFCLDCGSCGGCLFMYLY